MKDAIGNEIKTGDVIVYMAGRYNALMYGVVTEEAKTYKVPYSRSALVVPAINASLFRKVEMQMFSGVSRFKQYHNGGKNTNIYQPEKVLVVGHISNDERQFKTVEAVVRSHLNHGADAHE